MKMGDIGVTQTSSIMNYFQREKSPVATKTDTLTKDKKIVKSPILVDLKEDALGIAIGEKSHSKSEKTSYKKMTECIPNVEGKKANCAASDNNTEDIKNTVQSDCHDDSKCVIIDGHNASPKHGCFTNSDLNKNDHSEKKAKWSFSWKGKAKKAKIIDACPDSDSDFETNNESTDTSSKPCSLQKKVASAKSKSKKASKVKEGRTNPSTKILDRKPPHKMSDSTNVKCDTKTPNEISGITNTKTPEPQLSLPPENSNCVLESGNDSILIQNITESSCNENSGNNFNGDFGIANLESDKTNAGSPHEMTTTSKLQLSLTPGNNDCVLEIGNDSSNVQGLIESSSNANSTKNFEDESEEINLETFNDKKTEESVKADENIKAEESVKADSLRKNTETSQAGSGTPKKSFFDILMQSSKAKAFVQHIGAEVSREISPENSGNNCQGKGKVNKTSRRKKISGGDEHVGETDGNETAFVSPSRKKTKKKTKKESKVDKKETKEKTVRKSIRRKRRIDSAETISESDQKEEVDIECSQDNVETKPSTRSRRTRSSTSTRKELEESLEIVCSDKQLGTEDLLKDKEKGEDPVPQAGCEDDDESKVGESNLSCIEAKVGKEKYEDTVSAKQKRRSRRLRKACILDSDEDVESTESQKETKPSTSETTTKDNRPKKVSGPIAPIFLPGAWRRAKTKLEEAERLEAKLEVVEIEENSSSLQGSQTSKLPTQDEDDSPCIVNSSDNSTTNNESTSSMAVFLSMFQKPTPKPSTVVVQLIEAPFPKVPHVRQQDDEKDTKWNLAMIRNRFVKEEYFFMLDSNGSIKERNLSSWFRGIGISCSEDKTTADSKCIQLKVVLEMDKSQKQKIVSYLKTIYQGVPVKRLFKRCERQLELCEKSLMESENIASLVVQKESFKRAQVPSIKGPAVPASNFTKLKNTQVPEKMESFTKISRKKTTPKVKAKAEKKKESPLFLAFKNQENAYNKTEEIVKAKSKKERVKKTSIMDFMGIQTKESENISEIKRSATSKKGKKNKSANKIAGADEKVKERKKRARENEVDGGRDCPVEEFTRPTVKKAKLLNYSQEFKKPRKGQKRKVRSVESKENTDVVEKKDGKTEPLEKSAKCRKISSDDDFIKRPSRRCQSKSKVNTVNSDVAKDGGTETTCLRKSWRLQEKSTVEEADKQMEPNMAAVETCDGNKDSDIVELDVVEKYCIQQDDQSQSNEGDIKVVEAMTPVSEIDKVQTSDKKVTEQSSCSEKDADVETGSSLSSVLWSDCFKPRNSSEILGNTNSGSRLKNWLSEWKTLRERKLEALKRHEEKKRERLAAEKGGMETSSNRWYDDDDSDFYSSDDSSDENFCDEENVCNTMLLSGPVGCGKTSAVYACAEELGFKVIEVNSSTKRGGKYILSELQEATQSHQVSTKRNLQGQSSLLPHANSSTDGPGEKKQKGKEEIKKDKKLSKKGRPRKKEQLSKETQGPMSLILLDEVDVLFEEDKGFWVSVNTLRLNSKRPILMTASDPSAIEVDGEFEHVILKSPSLKLYAAYLQTVCLTKNVFVNPSDIRALSWLHYSDIRRLLLSLQFWVDSNAGTCYKRGVTVRNDLGANASILFNNETVSVVTDDNRLHGNEDNTLVEQSKDNKLVKNSNPIKINNTSTNTQDKCDVKINSAGLADSGSVSNTSSKNEAVNTTTTDIQQLSELSSTEDQREFENATSSCTSASELTNPELTNQSQYGNALSLEENKTTKLCEVSSRLVNQDSNQKPGDEVLVSEKCSQAQSLGENKVDSTKLCDVSSGVDKQDCNSKPSSEPLIVPSERTKIEMHNLCLESLLGLRNINNDAADVLETLKSKNSFQQKCLVTSHCQGLNLDIVYCNLETLFPCVFSSVNMIDDNPVKTRLSKHSDHPTSDKGNESDTCEVKASECQNDGDMKEKSFVKNDSKTIDEAKIQDKDLISKKLVGMSLKCLESFYEDMSFMESELCCGDSGTPEERFESWSAKISPGLKDSVDKHSPCHITWKTGNAQNELRGALEVASLEHAHKRFHDLCSHGGEQFLKYGRNVLSECYPLSYLNQDAATDDMQVTDIADADELTDTKILLNTLDAKPCLQTTCTENSASKARKREQNYTTVLPHLPELNYLNRSSVVMDYLPTLRAICRNESLRKAARVKRRFYHYLDSIGLHISLSAIQSLTEESYFN